MKMRKNKGKIHPSPSSSSSSTPPSNSLPNQNALSVLALLPAAILALISVLSAEDKEVLAYMVTRSMNSVNPSPSSSAEEKNKKSSNGKKLLGSSTSSSGGVVHKAPFFDCECFDCYRSYWFRWDSSPDKELIHKVIDEFEEFLFSEEQVKRSSSGKGRRRERIGRRGREKAKEEETEEVLEESFDVGLVGNEAEGEEEAAVAVEEVEAAAVVVVEREAAAAVDNYNKGLVRKVLPDVVGLFNSRLWGLWSPNV
ncbi:hypothetical protein RHSIM_Rhsim12G0023900 [Rhododendron simsii]|uniref:Uncharacterized protein n=1 Tax=Rhododendron simsii TaxID=118357 RepID=A0A834G3R8_RHOSS|nr:hypothetical protein RHSIM_Rhsim12G0023900 [Rhododendron simsii]